MGETISTFSGPMIGEGMLFITVNLVAFLVTLMLVLRIGSGKISQPIFFIGLGFLLSALIPVVAGTDYLWASPLVQTLFGLLGIVSLMKIFGVFEMVSGSRN